MPLSREPLHDDQLIRYLLGILGEDEAQRVDEESIVNDEVAARLRLVEDELVDAYVRGTLGGDRLARFESFYLASPARREKVAFAARFLAAVDGAAEPERHVSEPVSARRHQAGLFLWTVAAAAALFLATGLLLVRDVRLRRDMADARERITAAEHRVDAVSGQLADERRATAAARQALADARGTEPPAAVALLLMPQTRGVDPIPILSVPSGASTLPLDLQIEAAGATRFSAALRDPATNGVIWRSPVLARDPARRPSVVPVRVPAGVLKGQHYTLDLYELRAGATEFAGSYAFEVVRH